MHLVLLYSRNSWKCFVRRNLHKVSLVLIYLILTAVWSRYLLTSPHTHARVPVPRARTHTHTHTHRTSGRYTVAESELKSKTLALEPHTQSPLSGLLLFVGLWWFSYFRKKENHLLSYVLNDFTTKFLLGQLFYLISFKQIISSLSCVY